MFPTIKSLVSNKKAHVYPKEDKIKSVNMIALTKSTSHDYMGPVFDYWFNLRQGLVHLMEQ